MVTRSISSRPSRAGSIDLVRGAPLLLVFVACGFSVNGQGPVSDDAPRDGAGGEGSGSDAGVIDAPPDAPVDAPIDARTCPAAPSGCTVFQCPSSSSCYYLCGQGNKDSWTDARDSCTDNQLGHLATIDDDAENTCLAQMTQPGFPDIVWFGWVQASNGSEPAGGWGWEFGTSTYTAPNWGMPLGEPNNVGGNEDCGAMITLGAWIDGGCNTQARFVCELP